MGKQKPLWQERRSEAFRYLGELLLEDKTDQEVLELMNKRFYPGGAVLTKSAITGIVSRSREVLCEYFPREDVERMYVFRFSRSSKTPGGTLPQIIAYRRRKRREARPPNRTEEAMATTVLIDSNKVATMEALGEHACMFPVDEVDGRHRHCGKRSLRGILKDCGIPLLPLPAKLHMHRNRLVYCLGHARASLHPDFRRKFESALGELEVISPSRKRAR